jgi:kumamolisin
MIRPYLKRRATRPRDVDPCWNIRDLCHAYDWPSLQPGRGIIGIVELGGGWKPADVAASAAANGIPVPFVTDISVDATCNNPGLDADADGEVALDIQVAATAFSVATLTSALIQVFWTKDIKAGVNAASDAGCRVCSISWGQDEALWDTADALALEAAIQLAAQRGMITFAAAGDDDSSDGGPNAVNVDLPAGCFSSIACGGTSFPDTGASASDGIEDVWNNNPGVSDGSGTGGGYSRLFSPTPHWQIGVKGTGRMVPDVAANADPETGYRIVVDGVAQVVGGTSAVAPLYAGLFAALAPAKGPLGPVLWSRQTCFNDITNGDNGAFRAAVGPDPCTGLGSPIGTRLAGLMASLVGRV